MPCHRKYLTLAAIFIERRRFFLTKMKTLISILTLVLTATATAQKYRLNFSDSSDIKQFVVSHSLCEQIAIAIDYKNIIVQEDNSGIVLLQSISKLSKHSLFIPIASHYNMIYSTVEQAD